MTIPARIFTLLALAASVFLFAAEARFIPDDVFAVVMWPILWTCLHVPGFTDEHEGWLEVGLSIKAAMAVFGVTWRTGQR